MFFFPRPKHAQDVDKTVLLVFAYKDWLPQALWQNMTQAQRTEVHVVRPYTREIHVIILSTYKTANVIESEEISQMQG